MASAHIHAGELCADTEQQEVPCHAVQKGALAQLVYSEPLVYPALHSPLSRVTTLPLPPSFMQAVDMVCFLFRASARIARTMMGRMPACPALAAPAPYKPVLTPMLFPPLIR